MALSDCNAPSILERVLPAYPRDLSIGKVFDWYADNRPDAPALLAEEGFLSYGALGVISGQLARRLRNVVAPGSVIATLTNRSPETIIAWLAILKCGCTYLPLDPGHPTQSLRFILEDAAAALVIGESLLLAKHDLGQLPKLSLEDELLLAQSNEPLRESSAAKPTDPAYIMYTSGSTGRPKGVVVTHRGVIRLVRQQNYMDFNEREVYLLLSALAFDACTWEIWGALLNGGKLAIARGARLSIPQIEESIRRFGVTSVFFTSALFNAIVDINPKALAGLRQILVGGDVMSPEHVAKLHEHNPDAQMINGYGPTEATTFSVCYRLPLGRWNGAPIPIGVPIAHSTAYILDDDFNSVRDGEVGQLCLGGDGIAQGYLNRPELNAERFRPDPFIGGRAMMYLTGDLARRNANGLIEFLGRNDRQVKIEGRRIELDEIEHALRRDPAVADAVVALRKLGQDDKRIVAFLRPCETAPGGSDFVQLVMGNLRQRVADYMVPHEVHAVDAFPLTANGKVDRAALLQTGALA